jgi:TRAP transporter TAXI family solute receptor
MRGIVIAAVALLAFAPLARATDALQFLSVGSGEIDGGYYQTASALCAVVNAAERGRLRCSPEATQGSRYNIEGLVSGELDLALAQADLAFTAYHGSGLYAGANPARGLRTVAPLYRETMTVLARPQSGIVTQRDLAGRRVDIGPPASGRNASVRALLTALDTDLDIFAEIFALPGDAAIDALCAGRIDATILVVGHPSALVADAMARCGARPVSMAGPQLSRIVETAPFYAPGAVPAAAYPALDRDVPAVEIAALLMTSLATPHDAVVRFVAAIFAARDRLASTAPMLVEFAERGVEAQGAPPLHPGVAAALAALDR